VGARVVDQNPAHHLGRDTDKMRSILPVHAGLLNQPQVSLMH
jgi:hypothetical protein